MSTATEIAIPTSELSAINDTNRLRLLERKWRSAMNNSAGRYIHKLEIHDAPLDPNFLGGGRTLSDNEGNYSFYTIKPGAYPWGNHYNAWRPNHIHFSLIGAHLEQRLVTQMYFPGDPLFEFDPIFQGTPKNARPLLVSKFSMDNTEAEFALAYEFNIVLNGKKSTPFE